MKKIDDILDVSIFSSDEKKILNARKEIREIAALKKIYPASINEIYKAFGKNEIKGFTVPAINIRGLTYETARVVFRLAVEKNIGAFIFEIARSEIEYTKQSPNEYATTILAAAIRENYQGPVFLQGDHYQFKRSVYSKNNQEEIDNLKILIRDSINAGFYNIDIDASTLVDLDEPKLIDQQKDNFLMTAELTKFIREIEPEKITVSIGGEIGHIGGKNSTVSEFEAFMDGYLNIIETKKIEGISKVSVQTGTSHGGIPLPDGRIAEVKLDFDVLKNIGKFAREKYYLGGAVQHGASTLPNDLFDKFPKTNTLEIHLATGFQNILYEYLPKQLKNEMYQWLKKDCQKEWKEGESEEQFIYKTRKKALGQFKEKLWKLSEKDKKIIKENLYKQFFHIFSKLNVFDTKDKVQKYY